MISADSAQPLCGTVLVLEAATSAGSLALLRREAADAPWLLLARVDVMMGSGSDDQLTPAVAAMCTQAGVSLSELAGVVCGSGPGSFTSLRIVSALAKGLAFGLGAPLYAVPSLLLAASSPTEQPPTTGPVLVVLDALRDECYAQRVLIETDGLARLDGPPCRVPRTELAALAAGARVLEVDPARGVVPHAAGVRWCAPSQSFGPQALDAWEPLYGRLAEAQVKWESAHGRPLPAT